MYRSLSCIYIFLYISTYLYLVCVVKVPERQPLSCSQPLHGGLLPDPRDPRNPRCGDAGPGGGLRHPRGSGERHRSVRPLPLLLLFLYFVYFLKKPSDISLFGFHLGLPRHLLPWVLSLNHWFLFCIYPLLCMFIIDLFLFILVICIYFVNILLL